MSDIIDTVQLQETAESLVTLFEITLPSGTVAYFFDGLDDGTNNIYFPEKTITNSAYVLKEYIAIPIGIEGIESSSSGASNRPTLSVANIPILSRSISSNSDGADDEKNILDILNSEGITNNEDLLTSKVVIRRTLFGKTYTSSDSNPSAAPVEFPSQTYIIDRVSAENNIMVQFELANPMDIEGVRLPSRVVIGKYCPWRYQGHFLPNSTGTSSKDGGCTWALDSNGRFFDKDDNVITKNISSIPTYNAATTNTTRALGYKTKTITNGHTEIWQTIRVVPAEVSNGQYNPRSSKAYWQRLDVCGKTLNSCKIRFQGNNTDDSLNSVFVLPFGGFPGAKQFK
jgi:lambda family phage minor tail protein L